MWDEITCPWKSNFTLYFKVYAITYVGDVAMIIKRAVSKPVPVIYIIILTHQGWYVCHWFR